MRRVNFTEGTLIAALACFGCGSGSGSGPTASELPMLSVSQPAKIVSQKEEAPEASQRAAALQEQGRLIDALQAASEGIRQSPQNALAYETRASIHHKLGHWEEAAEDFTAAIERNPQSPRLLNNRGFLWLSRQDFAKALQDFDAAIALDPEYPNSYNNRGLLHIAEGRYRQAVLDLDEALRADPAYIDAYNNRGFALMHLGVWERALGDFQRALTLDPQNVNAISNRGFAKQNLGDTNGAILDFTSAMMIDPDNPKYYIHRRESYLKQGAHDKAQQDAAKIVELRQVQRLNAAISAQPQNVEPYLARARYFHDKGNETRAEADLTQAVERFPESLAARIDRASLWYEMDKFQAAIDDCNAVLAKEADQRAFSIRGDCRLELDDIDGALADFEQAKRLDTRVADAYFLKGQKLSQKGDTAAAKEFHSRAEEIDPSVATRLK